MIDTLTQETFQDFDDWYQKQDYTKKENPRFAAWSAWKACKTKTVEKYEKDITTLILRLKGEDPDTFSPEVSEVMERKLSKANDVLKNALELGGFTVSISKRIGW